MFRPLAAAVLTSLIASAAHGGAPEDLALIKLFEKLPGSEAAEFQFAVALREHNLPAAALTYQAAVYRRGESGPYFYRSLEELVQLQAQLQDRFLIGSLIARDRVDAWGSKLSADAMARLNLLSAEIAYRKSLYAQALALADAVPLENPVGAKAQYLKAIILADPRFPGGAQAATALAVLERVVARKNDNTQENFPSVQGLTALALGRIAYVLGRYPQAVAHFKFAETFPRFRREALLEGAFARFQNDDITGALAALRSPEITGAFVPEAPVLEGVIHGFFDRQDEADRALTGAHRFTEDAKQLDRLLAEKGPKGMAELIARSSPEIPAVLLPSIRGNNRFLTVLQLAQEHRRELAQIEASPTLRGTPLAIEVAQYLTQNLAVLEDIGAQYAKNRVTEVIRNAQSFADQADIVTFEVARQRMWKSKSPDRFDRPIAALRKFIPRIEEGSMQKAELLFQLAALTRAKGDFPEAQRLCRSILEKFPRYDRNDEVLFMSGDLSHALGDRTGGLASFQQLVNQYPLSSFAADAAAQLSATPTTPAPRP
jgi:tetratricopeptide (TPR) repeat protein